jgi:serine/threonine-protein kinase
MLGWLLIVVTASAVGLMTVSLFSGGLTSTSTTPLSNDAVSEALASVTSSGGGEAPTTPVKPQLDEIGKAHSLGSPGGTLIAGCDGANTYLFSWSPAQGWEVDDYLRGPARSTMVTFEGDDDSNDDRQVTVTVTCRSGQPVAASVPTDE